MKKIKYSLLCVLFCVACKENKDENTAINFETYTIEQFMDNESVSAAGFSPDNQKVLLNSNRSGIYNAYTVPSGAGEIKPVTQSDSSSIFALSYFPDDERILFEMDDNGDEVYKIFMKDPDTITRLTPPDARVSYRGWSKDGSRFYYGSNERDDKLEDLYEMNIATFKPKMIYKNDKAYECGALSSDKKYLLLTKSINTNDINLFLLEIESGKMTKINNKPSKNVPQDFAPDNNSFYYTTDEAGEFSTLMQYTISSGEKKMVEEKNWDINAFFFTKNGKYSVMYSNEDAKNVIEVKNAKSGMPVAFPDFYDQEITSVSFSDDESMVLLNVGGSNMPTNIYSYNLENDKLKELTDVLNPEINPDNLVSAKVIRYKSFDGLEIPAIYYEPKNATAKDPAPALVWVHGGPGGQSRQGYNSFIQYIVNHGYAVLAVNNRGSSGYGKSFYKMDDQNHGDKDLKDCIAGKDWLADQPNINGDKIGILGGSYGGYMTMAALTFAPDEFDVGVNLFGVTNWMRTLKSIPPWWESFKDALYEEMGNPNTSDSLRLKRISPLFHTENVTKPLIVLQGSQDPRVLKVESDEIVEGVRKNGVPVEYVLFEDEGHGFVKKENQIEAYERILNFLDKYLKENKVEDADVKGGNRTIEAD